MAAVLRYFERLSRFVLVFRRGVRMHGVCHCIVILITISVVVA